MDRIIEMSNNKFLDINIKWNKIRIGDIECKYCKKILNEFHEQFIEEQFMCFKCKTIYRIN